ncbi:hypothetical protein DFJ74DRAFT_757209 [Hyaloraphidium curvatum]|nr:hypothetical protein DFJ74DRAFT_757209 [Hyaloraphidium curvatum]
MSSLQHYVAAKAAGGVLGQQGASDAGAGLPPRFGAAPSAATLRTDSAGSFAVFNDAALRSATPGARMLRTDSVASVASNAHFSEAPRMMPRTGSVASMAGHESNVGSVIQEGAGLGYTSVFGEMLAQGPLLRSSGGGWKPCRARAVLSHTGVGGKLLLFKDERAEHPTDTLDFGDVVRVMAGASAKSGGLLGSRNGGFRYEIRIEGSLPSGFPALAADSSNAREQWISALELLVPRVTSSQAAHLMASRVHYERGAAQMESEIDRLRRETEEQARAWQTRYAELQAKYEESEHKRDRMEGELQILRQQRAARPASVISERSPDLDGVQRTLQDLTNEVARSRQESPIKEAIQPLRKAIVSEVGSTVQQSLSQAVNSIVQAVTDLSKSSGDSETKDRLEKLQAVIEDGSGSILSGLEQIRSELANSGNKGATTDMDLMMSKLMVQFRKAFGDLESSVNAKVLEDSKRATDSVQALVASSKQVQGDISAEVTSRTKEMRAAAEEALGSVQGRIAAIEAAVEKLGHLSRAALENFADRTADACGDRVDKAIAPLLGPRPEIKECADRLGDLTLRIDTVATADHIAGLEARLTSVLTETTGAMGAELSRLTSSVASVAGYGANSPTRASSPAFRSASPTLSLFGDKDAARLEKLREVVEDAIGEALAEDRKRTSAGEKASLALINDKLASIKVLFEEQIRASAAADRRISEPPSPTRSVNSYGADRLASDTRSHLVDIEAKIARLEKESNKLHDIQEGWLKQLVESMRHMRKDVSDLAASERTRDRYLQELSTGARTGLRMGMDDGTSDWSGPSVAELVSHLRAELGQEIRSAQIQQLATRAATEDVCVGTETEGLQLMFKEVKELEERCSYLTQHVRDLEESRAILEKEKEQQMLDLAAIIDAKRMAWASLRQAEGSDSTIAAARDSTGEGEGQGSRLRELLELRGAIRGELSGSREFLPGQTSPGEETVASALEQAKGRQKDSSAGRAKRVISGLWTKAFPSQ